MKKSIITALLFAGFATAGFSQERNIQRVDRNDKRMESPEQQSRLATDRMDKQLSLSENQKTQIYNLNLDRAKKMNKAHEKAEKQRMEQHKKMQAEHASSDRKINSVLSPAQQSKYASLKKERADKFKGRKGNHNNRNKNRTSRNASPKNRPESDHKL
ncbi:hypothetical protein ADIARSV_1976 [Arcticibacter svalbardensis MN12-7]|uniref:DUF4890 domain-containing protein n=1 Tax=Arcticibacter svalbardensis MN12-7 TaxID=1150600 RepID=R9GT27_9SPHI|nr:hypothetical protein [Arcticibacter svalbardensis]EOR94871.1 hypothetical protein ADIARSV_1976 [Arcticibacter svalbardensis MN12-7]